MTEVLWWTAWFVLGIWFGVFLRWAGAKIDESTSRG